MTPSARPSPIEAHAPGDELPRLERRVDGASHRRFLEASGTRMALLGDELGRWECWMWPLALVRDLELWVRAERLHRGRDLARAVATQPDHAEVEFLGPGFRIRQRVFVARERRAAWLEFDVECERALELEVRFTPRFEPMWPAGLGGRLALRDDETGAVALSEELGRFAALLGGPEAEPCELDADHAAPRTPLVVRLPCSPARAARGPLVFFIVGAQVDSQALSPAARVGEQGAAQGRSRLEAVLARAREEYRWVASHWMHEARELEAKWKDFLARTTHFESDDARHAEAFLWAKIAIEKAWVEVDGLGRGLVAGLGPSGASERPGFGWFFGGDALTATRAMCGYGDFEGARRVLEFVAGQQRADGKLQHELVLSARLCNWTEDFPYAYYKAQITPGFLACLHHYWLHSGDRELVAKLWPTAVAAYRCCLANLEPDGLLSNRKLGIAAVEAGELVGKIRSEIYLHGIWLSALVGMESLARALGHDGVADEAQVELERARRAAESFWSEKDGRYGFAQLSDGALNSASTSYQALALSRGRLDATRSLAAAAALNRPNLASDWGVRLFADDASVYDASSYNTGSVFPYTNNFAILAQFTHGLATSAHQLLASQVALHNFSGLGFVPEHLRADRCETPQRGVPHQIFSSSCIVQATVFGVAGLVASADDGWIAVRPQLAPNARRMALRGLRVGATRFDLELERAALEGSRRRTVTTVQVRKLTGPALKIVVLVVAPALSRGAREHARELDGVRFGGSQTFKCLGVEVEAQAQWRVEYAAGPELLLPDEALVEGGCSQRLRVCEVEFDERSVVWTVWGLAGRTYRVGWCSDVPVRFEGASKVSANELELHFPSAAGGGFVSRELRAWASD